MTKQKYKGFFEFLYSIGLFPAITRPSRITSETYTLIDNIFTKNINFNKKCCSGLLINDISDHLPIFVISDNLDRKHESKKDRYVRNLSDENISTFSMALSDKNCDNVMNATHVNLAGLTWKLVKC